MMAKVKEYIHPPKTLKYPEALEYIFVTDGRIQFLGDSFHELKNQTVEMSDIEN